MIRAEIRNNGARMRERLQLNGGAAQTPVAGYGALRDEIEFGQIWSRGVLTLQERLIISLTVCCLLRHTGRLRELAAASLDAGLAPESILEVFLQAGIYGGFPVVEDAATLAQAVFAERGVDVPNIDHGFEEFDTLAAEAEKLRRVLHGGRAKGGHANPDNPCTGPLYEIASAFGYGAVWRREGLSLEARLLCAVAAFTALGDMDASIRKFARSALDFGFSAERIQETMMQTMPFCGFPRALRALTVLGEVIGAGKEYAALR